MGWYGPGTSLTSCIRTTAAEIDSADVGHTIIVRCRIVIICKRFGSGLVRVEGVGPASDEAMTGRARVHLRIQHMLLDLLLAGIFKVVHDI